MKKENKVYKKVRSKKYSRKKVLVFGIVWMLAMTLIIGPVTASPILWTIETVDSTGNVGWDTSIALDTSNYPHISYFDDTNDDLKYAHMISSGWNFWSNPPHMWSIPSGNVGFSAVLM